MFNKDCQLIYEAYTYKVGMYLHEHTDDPRIKVGSIVKFTDQAPYSLQDREAIITHINKDSYGYKLIDNPKHNYPYEGYKHIEYISAMKHLVKFERDSKLEDINDASTYGDLLDI